MTRSRQLHPFLLAAFVAAILSVSGCGSDVNPNPAPVMAQQPVTVRTAEVRVAEAAEALRFAGVVRPRERATLTFQVGGVLRERPVDIGQAVVKGELLARLFNPSLDPAREVAQARLREVEAQTEQARLDAERADRLRVRGMLSVQERDRLVAQRDALQAGTASARAALWQAEQLQREMRLEAPFAGTVEVVLVEPGEYVAPGQPVLRLAADEGYEVEIAVPVSLLDGLEPGLHVPVWASLNDATWQGRVIEIGRSASQGSVVYPVVVALERTPARAGDAVEVGLSRRHEDRAAVPISAVMGSGDGLSVFRLEGERVRRVRIEVVRLQGESVLLDRDALRIGDRVVHSGLTRLADGDLVRPLP